MAAKPRSATFKAGLAMRRKVMGAEYVENSFKNTDAFWMPFQEYLTEHGWGAVWTRPGLPPKTRSMLTMAFCIALNRPHELKIHLRGAIRKGVTPLEVRELLLHAMLYCGGPAALDGYHTVRAALPEILKSEGKGRARRRKA
jgi:4-carboxymuconolactone decarboxylase